MLALLPVLLAAAPVDPGVHRFLHLLAGAPVGEIEIRFSPRYSYLSRHFFRRGEKSEERFVPEAEAGPVWASGSLITPHPIGCWPVAAELTRERGQACVTSLGPRVKGTLLGQPFTAKYVGGQLQELKLAESEFIRSEAPLEFEDPFGEGFELRGEGPNLGLDPPVKGTRVATPLGSGTEEDCFAAARAWIAAKGSAWELVLGVIEADGRGWPHAWVRNHATGEERDPSRPSSEGRWLALPTGHAAEIYLELLGKRRALVRVGSR